MLNLMLLLFIIWHNGEYHRLGLKVPNPQKCPWMERAKIKFIPTKPSTVDWSSHLPPVGNQGNQGSCVAWATGYYYQTFQEWKEHRWNVNVTLHQFSPAFVYNLINGGEDRGAFIEDAFKLFVENGCATLEDFPYNEEDFTSWPSEDAFQHAILFRDEQAFWFPTNSDSGIEMIKTLLADTNLVVIAIKVYPNFDNIQNYNNTYCVSDVYDSSRGGHAVTIVGYDDNRATHDGTGAFRLVNSWGTAWGDNGFFWMSYQAVMSSITCYGYAYYSTDKIGYHPQILAKVRINHPDRNSIYIDFGFGEHTSPAWHHRFFDFQIFNYDNAENPFPPNNLVFDLTDGIPHLSDNVFFHTFDMDYDGHSGTIIYYSAVYNALETPFTQTPLMIPDDGTPVYLDVDITGGTPDISVDPASFAIYLPQDTQDVNILKIYNTGDGALVFHTFNNIYSKSKGSGGPDQFGYHWIDSDEPSGPTFNWIEISSDGTPLNLGDDDYRDIPLPFSFSFYGAFYDTVRVSSNGYLTFGDNSGTDWGNDSIPNPNDPNNLIASFWDDLDPSAGGNVYVYSNDTIFIAEYKDVPHYGNNLPYTFEVILKNDGSIKYQYLYMSGQLNSATVGIENPDGSDGLQVAYNEGYVHDNLAIKIVNLNWLYLSPTSGMVEPGDSAILTVTFNTTGVDTGFHHALIFIVSNDPDEDTIDLPVTLHVHNGFSGQKGDVNHDGERNIFDVVRMVNIALSIPPEPTPYERWAADMNDDGNIDILDVVSLVNVILNGGKNSCSEPSITEAAIYVKDNNVILSNSGNISGLQFELIGNIENIILNKELKGFELFSHSIGNKEKIMIFSPKGEVIKPGTWSILKFKGKAILSKVVLSDEEGRKVRLSSESKQSQVMLEVTPSLLHTTGEIVFSIPNSTIVNIGVFDISGRRVISVVDNLLLQSGTHKFPIDVSSLSSGVYFVVVQTTSYGTVQKKLVVRK